MNKDNYDVYFWKAYNVDNAALPGACTIQNFFRIELITRSLDSTTKSCEYALKIHFTTIL